MDGPAEGISIYFNQGKKSVLAIEFHLWSSRKVDGFLAICEGRVDGVARDAGLVCKRSVDDGATWSGLKVIVDWVETPSATRRCWLMAKRTTYVVWIAHTVRSGEESEETITRGNTKQSTCVLLRHSRDEGQTWNASHDITKAVKRDDLTWCGCDPGVGIQLESGRERRQAQW
ncbi:MAG: glycoside hydrolase [Fuerstiella sp.]|nr:glycoside hydrolase [Fuerstiella sp.]